MDNKYKLNVKGEEAKRVRDEIRMSKLKRKLFKSILPSEEFSKEYVDRYFTNYMIDGHHVAKDA